MAILGGGREWSAHRAGRVSAGRGAFNFDFFRHKNSQRGFETKCVDWQQH